MIMEYLIENSSLHIVISGKGAEIQSVKNADGTEYIWEGDPAFWEDRAINLFPIIGRLHKQGYTVYGERYGMGLHGFLQDIETEVIEKGEDGITFRLQDSESTMSVYPFPFVLDIKYKLEGNKLNITFMVENTGERDMYFGIGGHPGFALPFEKDLAFEDYFLEFEEGREPYRLWMAESELMSGVEEAFALRDGRYLDLKHSLFDKDAIILRDMGHSVKLKARSGERSVSVEFPDMRYLGLWHANETEAPFICIEPWTSYQATEGETDAFDERKDMLSLPPGETYRNEWSITFH